MTSKIRNYEIQIESNYGYKTILDYLNQLREDKRLAGDIVIKHRIEDCDVHTTLWSSNECLKKSKCTLISDTKEYIDSIISAEGIKLINIEIERVLKLNKDLELNEIKSIRKITMSIIFDIIDMWKNDFKKQTFSRYLHRVWLQDHLTLDDTIFLNLSDLDRRIEENLPLFGYVVINGYIQEL